MRLAGIEKGGFYPYPPHMAEATASWFIPLLAGARGRILDPCAGEGEIASLLGKLVNRIPEAAIERAARTLLNFTTAGNGRPVKSARCWYEP